MVDTAKKKSTAEKRTAAEKAAANPGKDINEALDAAVASGKAGKGKKECPSCHNFVAARLSTCTCGHVFAGKAKVVSSTNGKGKVIATVALADIAMFVLRCGSMEKAKKELEGIQANRAFDLAVKCGSADEALAALAALDTEIKK